MRPSRRNRQRRENNNDGLPDFTDARETNTLRLACNKFTAELFCMLLGVRSSRFRNITYDPDNRILRLYHEDEEYSPVYDTPEGAAVPESAPTRLTMLRRLKGILEENGYRVEDPSDE